MITARPLLRPALAAAALAASFAMGLSACGPKDPPASATGSAARRKPSGTCSCVCGASPRDSFPTSPISTTDETDYRACGDRCTDYESTHGTSCQVLFRKHEAPEPRFEDVAREVERTARPVAPKDSDGDSTPDAQDRCPELVGPKDNGGCPDTDIDGDGIIDRNDRCADRRGPRENAGCPDVDTDGDGVADRSDRCKDEPETRNSYQDDDGCPDALPEKLAKFTGRIEGVVFKTNSAEIDKQSFPVLEKAAEALREFAGARFEIEGHTDNSGSAEKNTDLSRRRAESVKAWLVGKGVADARLVAAGYGPSRPIADNKSSSGRAQNRRVEFKLLSSASR